LQESDLSAAISPATQDLLNKDNSMSYGRQLEIVVSTLDKLVREKISLRRNFNGKKENSCG
jgi:hypothetical protein